MKKAKKAPAPKMHGWENHNGGKPPFEGAAPPIHLHMGGKFYKGKKDKDEDGDCE